MKSNRILSFDIIRGFAVASTMITANPGSANEFAQFHHAVWHGLTFTDFGFPLFIFSMCLVIPLVAEKRLSDNSAAYLQSVFSRGLKLIAIGLIFNLVPQFDWANWRLPGVLQRLGLIYIIINLWYYSLKKWFPKRSVGFSSLMAAFGLAAGYWLIMHPFGYQPETNLGALLDRAVFQPHHLYRNGIYDPEGLWSTLGALINGLLGCAAGSLLLDKQKTAGQKIISLLVWGGLALTASFIIQPFNPWNKRLWTSSFGLITAGSHLILLAAIYWLVDIKGRGKWFSPLHYLGRNSLFIYIATNFIIKLIWPIQIAGQPIPYYLTSHYIRPWAGVRFESLVFSLLYLTAWILLARFLYRKRWILRI